MPVGMMVALAAPAAARSSVSSDRLPASAQAPVATANAASAVPSTRNLPNRSPNGPSTIWNNP